MSLNYLKADPGSVQDVVAFIMEVDHSFEPPIASRVDVSAYAKKLLNQGIVVTCQMGSGHKIVGLAAFYCTPVEYPYAFLSYIASNGEIPRVGSALLEEVLSYCRAKGSKGIQTQTWESNLRSQNLFTRHGFAYVRKESNRLDGKRSIILQLDF